MSDEDPVGEGASSRDAGAASEGASSGDEARVREALREVVDPCSAATGSNLDVVEMGMVKAIEVEDGHARVELRITTPVCTMMPYFDREVGRHVGALEGIASVDLETDMGTEWTEDMMSEAAKRKRQAVLDEQEARYREELAVE